MHESDRKAHEDMIRALGGKVPEQPRLPKDMFLAQDPDMPDLSLCSFQYLADELRRRGATVTPASHGGDHEPEYNGGDTPLI